jgi:hypothetical protein
VTFPEPFRHEFPERLADQFFAAVTEHFLSGCVCQHDLALSVDRQNRLRRCLEQCPYCSFTLFSSLAGLHARGLIDAGSDHKLHRAFAYDHAVRPANEQTPTVLGDPMILLLIRCSADELFEFS